MAMRSRFGNRDVLEEDAQTTKQKGTKNEGNSWTNQANLTLTGNPYLLVAYRPYGTFSKSKLTKVQAAKKIIKWAMQSKMYSSLSSEEKSEESTESIAKGSLMLRLYT